MSLKASPQESPRIARQQTPIVDPTTVDAAPVRIGLPRVHLAGCDAHYDAHIDVGRHGLSLFLTPTAPYPSLDIDGTREELTRLAQALTGALASHS